MSNYVPGIGNPAAKLMIVGEAPGKYEDERCEPFVGPSGDILNSLLTDIGVSRSEVYITNIIKYRPPDNDLRRLSEINIKVEDQLPQLWSEIDTIKPNAILALGNYAFHHITGLGKIDKKSKSGYSGIFDYRGSILSPINRVYPKVIPSIHPANLLPGREGISFGTRAYIKLDYGRAAEESKFKDFRLPQRNIEVCRSAAQLYRFLETYRSHDEVSVDIETYQCIPSCIALAFVPYHAISIPLLRSIDLVSDSDLVVIYELLAKLFQRVKVLGQNIKFDEQRLFFTSRLPIRVIYDSRILMHCLYPEFPGRLQFITSIFTKEPYYKDEGKSFDPSKDKIERLLIYNAKDAATTLEAHQVMIKEAEERGLSSFYNDYLMKLHPIYVNIERRGFRIDKDKREELRKKYEILQKEHQKELDDLAGFSVNVASPKAVPKLLYEVLRLPVRAGCDEDTLVALLCNNTKNDKQRRAIDLVLKLRRFRKTKSTYLNAELDFDDRLRCSINQCGTETGRRSSSVLKPPTRPIKIGISLLTLTKRGDIGSDIREMIVADEGKSICEIDVAQAEARVAAILSDDNETLEMFDTIDIHSRTAHWFFGTEESTIKSKFPDQRYSAKEGRYLGQYGGSKRRLMTSIASNAYKLHIGCARIDEWHCDGKHLNPSEWKCGQWLEAFHSYTPKIKKVFHRAVQNQLMTDRTIVGPFGRSRTFFERYDDELLRSAYAHACSSIVADHVGHAMIRLIEIKPDIEILLEFHDALYFQDYDDKILETAKLVKNELEKEIDFSKGSFKRGKLKLPVDIKIGKNLKHLKEIKL
jgi:DNA polymerase